MPSPLATGTKRARLNPSLLAKLVRKTSQSEKYVREQISKRAARLGIASEAAQILWAREFGIGTTSFTRSLPSHIQDQVRGALPTMFARPTASSTHTPKSLAKSASGKSPTRLAIDNLLADDELKARCGDLLMASTKFDRVFREATTVLDDRLKRLGGIKNKMNPADLVGKVINPDPKRAILVVSDDADEQEGFHATCKGLVLAFRNPSHHQLTDETTREEALKFCGFIDYLLAVLNKARKSPTSL